MLKFLIEASISFSVIEGKIHSTTKVGLDVSSPYKYSIYHIYYGFSAIHLNFWLFSNTNAIIPLPSRGAKKIPSLCSKQALRSAVASAAWQSHPIKTRLQRAFRVRNDIVKIYIAFILVLDILTLTS